jgi:hypothetical protein
MSLPYKSAIKKILKQVHPDTLISSFSIIFLEKILYNLLTHSDNLEELLDNLPGELRKHAKSEIAKGLLNKSRIVSLEYCKKNLENIIGNDQDELIKIISVLEYLLAEILELSGNCARDSELTKIDIFHIIMCIRNDEELYNLFPKLMFSLLNETKFDINIAKIHANYDSKYLKCNLIFHCCSHKKISKSATRFIEYCVCSFLNWTNAYYGISEETGLWQEEILFKEFINTFFGKEMIDKWTFQNKIYTKNLTEYLQKKLKKVLKLLKNINAVDLKYITEASLHFINFILNNAESICGNTIESHHVLLVLENNNLLKLLFSVEQLIKINNFKYKQIKKPMEKNNKFIITI